MDYLVYSVLSSTPDITHLEDQMIPSSPCEPSRSCVLSITPTSCRARLPSLVQQGLPGFSFIFPLSALKPVVSPRHHNVLLQWGIVFKTKI